MISCDELSQLLIDFVAQELPAEQILIVEEHLRDCLPCHTYLETYRLTVRLSRRLPRQPMPPELVSRLRCALQAARAEGTV